MSLSLFLNHLNHLLLLLICNVFYIGKFHTMYFDYIDLDF